MIHIAAEMMAGVKSEFAGFVDIRAKVARRESAHQGSEASRRGGHTPPRPHGRDRSLPAREKTRGPILIIFPRNRVAGGFPRGLESHILDQR